MAKLDFIEKHFNLKGEILINLSSYFEIDGDSEKNPLTSFWYDKAELILLVNGGKNDNLILNYRFESQKDSNNIVKISFKRACDSTPLLEYKNTYIRTQDNMVLMGKEWKFTINPNLHLNENDYLKSLVEELINSLHKEINKG